MTTNYEEYGGVSRRDVLNGIGAAGLAGTVGLTGLGGSTPAAAAPSTTPRTETVSGNVFLGGDFFELGVRPDGGFGPGVTAPSSFYGADRGNEPEHDAVDFPGEIGMYADLDGFADETAPQYRYEYFLPGTPEERWSVGYRDADGENVASNGRQVGAAIPTTIEPTSSGETLSVDVSSTFQGVLGIDQTYRFGAEARFFETEVTLTNAGDASIDDVRYQRSVDPDNGVDTGCDFVTKNTIVSQPPTSDEALVKAELSDGDPCDLAQVSSIPFFYYSQEASARVSSGSSSSGLSPSPVVYAPEDYDSAPAEGTTGTADVYVAITFDVGTLAPGESTTVTFYPGLTDDIDETIGDIGACLAPRDRGRDDPRSALCPQNRDRGRSDDPVSGDRDRSRGGSTSTASGSSGRTRRGRRSSGGRDR